MNPIIRSILFVALVVGVMYVIQCYRFVRQAKKYNDISGDTFTLTALLLTAPVPPLIPTTHYYLSILSGRWLSDYIRLVKQRSISKSKSINQMHKELLLDLNTIEHFVHNDVALSLAQSSRDTTEFRDLISLLLKEARLNNSEPVTWGYVTDFKTQVRLLSSKTGISDVVVMQMIGNYLSQLPPTYIEQMIKESQRNDIV